MSIETRSHHVIAGYSRETDRLIFEHLVPRHWVLQLRKKVGVLHTDPACHLIDARLMAFDVAPSLGLAYDSGLEYFLEETAL